MKMMEGHAYVYQQDGMCVNLLLFSVSHVSSWKESFDSGNCVSWLVCRDNLRSAVRLKSSSGTVCKLLECRCRKVTSCNAATAWDTLVRLLSLLHRMQGLAPEVKQKN